LLFCGIIGGGGPVSAADGASANLGLKNTQDVAELRIGVVQGSAHDTWAKVHFPKAQLLQFVGFSDLMAALEAGKTDASIGDAETIVEALKGRPQLTRLDDPVFSSEVGAGFRKDSAELRAQFDQFLARIRADGTLADMERRWYAGEDRRMPPIDMPADAPPLRIGNSIGGMPQVAIQDNVLVGSEVELAVRFAASIGRRIEFSTMDWGALIPSLVSGKIDAVISGMYITPERRERIDFSTSYHASENYVIVRRSDLASAGTDVAAPVQREPSYWEALKVSFENNIIREQRYLLIWGGLKVTVLLSILSCLLGTVLGALVCYMRMSANALLRNLAITYIAILRGMPVLVLLMLIFYVVLGSVNIDPVLVAVIAFGLNFGAYVAEIFRSGIEGIDRGQTEAGIAMGFSRVGAFRHIVLPQTLQRILPVYKGEFISMVKMTSIVGYVAVQDLTKASDIIRSRTFDAFFPLVMVAVLYFLVSWLLLQALEYVERQTDPFRRRRRAMRT
jgi:polar amino acid transport system substrate-binding protein